MGPNIHIKCLIAFSRASFLQHCLKLKCVSYIFCRSVHNIHIECLWCNVTRGFGCKWSNFFLSLEYSCSLRPDLEAHIWLLHHFFLAPMNQDAGDWARTWNEYKFRLDMERTRSLCDLFFFGMIENGLRGFDSTPEPTDDDHIDGLNVYGIDWEELHNADIIAHHTEHNTDQELNPDNLDNLFSNNGLHWLSHVEVLEPSYPFMLDEVANLDVHLALNPHSQSYNMTSQHSV
ncbi:hypothetical protein B0H14DRAFT_2404946 [Mycena olivaceomarginata]|nr:hypothetical protein B0H14DRAFT_2404946 [Mycena olivaceomarginata]